MNQYVQLAKFAIEEYIKHGKIFNIPPDLPKEFFGKKSGVFVSIHNGKNLRGCIGTYLPAHENLAEEIVQNAVAACSKDSRFGPITVEELPVLTVKISLLSAPEKISALQDLDPGEFGVIVKSPDGRCGLLLPGLDGIDSAEQQLSIACQKGGINPIIEKNLEIYKFTVEKHAE